MVTRIPARMIETTGVTPGSYSAADITVNSAGQITSASTNSVASSGGGPKITSIVVTDSSYTNTDDTAVGLSGGYIKVTGTGFSTGCSIIIGATVATSVSFINSTEVRAQVPAQSAGTYTVYLVNSDGGVGIRVNGLNYSSTPTWTTTSPLSDGVIDSAVSIQLTATSNSTVTYALQAGSTLPAGLSLSSSGLLTGTVTSITADTTYNFTIVATDQENQDTPQAFSITITVNDPNFKNTVLLLQADTAPTVISDASTNNFDLSVAGDARASNFTPYGTGWSVFFDGNADYFTVPANAAFAYGTGAFTIEAWVYRTGLGPAIYYGSVILAQAASSNNYVLLSMSGDSNNQITFYLANSLVLTSTNLNFNQWYHIAVVRENTSTNGVKLYVNGALNVSGTSAANLTDTTIPVSIGDYSHSNILGMNGYISNLRVVKGTAVYTATFTPPTQPLTVIANTSLLTCNANRFLDSSSNGFAVTRNGDAAVRSFNPFGITNTGTSGSAYFDGTGDYITVPDNANLEPLGGNFTIETWFYLNAVTTGTQICGKSWWTPFYIEGSNLVTYLSSNGSTWDIASNQVIITSVATFRWYHVAMVRNGTSIKVYVNGTETLSLTSSAALHDGSDTFTIGARGTTYLNGYVADLRFVKGTAVYTANFTPPTQPLTAIANTQLLTLQYDQPHNNHTFLDSSSNQFLITRNGNTTQGTFSPFSQSGHSVYFDGTGDYLSIPTNTAFDLPGDFTIEFWVYIIPLSGNQNYHIVTRGGYQSGTQDWYIAFNSSYFPTFGFGNPSNNINLPSILPNTWNHIAFSRSGTTLQGFVNGVRHTNTITTNINLTNTRSVIIGTNTANDISNLMSGYISNLRIIKGTALYTTTFTPSTTPLTNVANTSLLACHANRFVDGSANNFTVTRNGDVKITAFGPFSTTAYSPAVHGGSAYFDGTGDYLTLTSKPILGSSPWTIESWIYPVDSASNQIILSQGPLNSTSVTSFSIDLTNNIVGLQIWDGSVNRVLMQPTITLKRYEWGHVALTFDGTNYKIWQNGILSSTVAASGYYWNSYVSSANMYVGLYAYQGNTTKSCYMSDLRVVVGTALYTTDFTPPTAPVTATTNTQLLLNFTDAAMRDSRGLAVLETVGDAKTSTVQVKYGTGSMRFDGTGDALVSPYSVNYELGTSNFTIETWFYIAANSAQDANSNRSAAIIETRDAPGTANGMFIIVQGDTTTTGTGISFGIRIGGTTYSYASTGSIAQTTWHHLAVVRSGTTCTTYLNGTSIASNTSFGHDIKSASNMYIGSSPLTSFPRVLNGYLDDLRITRGIARYTANFTPPAAKFLAR